MENITTLVDLFTLSLMTLIIVGALMAVFGVAMYYLWRRR